MRYLVMKKIKLYSFFSGCGLLDLGMEEAGFDIAMVSEKYEPSSIPLGLYGRGENLMNLKYWKVVTGNL